MNKFNYNRFMFKNNHKHNNNRTESLIPEEVSLPYYEKHTGFSEVEFFLDEEIKDQRYYREIIHRLYNSTDEDKIRIFINSAGGNLIGALALIDAIKFSEAEVTAIVTGECASAGSLIALSCDGIMVSPNARVMIHQPFYGVVDSASIVQTRVKHNEEWFSRVIEDAYKGFLTNEEIQLVKDGREFWFFAEEVTDRLHSRFDYLAKLEAAQGERDNELNEAESKEAEEAEDTEDTEDTSDNEGDFDESYS